MTEALRCSAKGCRADAARAILWNNPSLHTPERRKVWLGFYRTDVTIDEIPEGAG